MKNAYNASKILFFLIFSIVLGICFFYFFFPVSEKKTTSFEASKTESKNTNSYLVESGKYIVMLALRKGLPIILVSIDQGKEFIEQKLPPELEISKLNSITQNDDYFDVLVLNKKNNSFYILRTKFKEGRIPIHIPNTQFPWSTIKILGGNIGVSNLICKNGKCFMALQTTNDNLLKNEYKNYFIFADVIQDSMEWHYNWKNYSNTLQPFLIRFYSLAFGNDTLVAVGSSIPTSPTIDFSDIKNYKGLIIRSADGKNWNEVTNKNLGFLHQVHFVNGAFYALDLQGGIYKSKDDAKTWLLVYSNPKFVFTKVVGRDAINSPENIPTLTSKNFNNRDSGDNVSMSINNVGMIAIGGSQETGGVLLRSQDNGETWKLEKEFSNTYISDSIYSLNQKKFIIIGNGFNNGAPVYLMLE